MSAHLGTPGSLPRDYAILSQFATSTGEDQTQNKFLNGTDDSHTQTGNPVTGVAPRTKISSIPPTPAVMTVMPTENTHLLSPPIPRIEEDLNLANHGDDLNTWDIFREELGILTKYSLPVFVFVKIVPSRVTFTDLLLMQHPCVRV